MTASADALVGGLWVFSSALTTL